MQLKRFFRSHKHQERSIARSLYKGVLAGALSPQLYIAGFAEDTFNGRFQQVALHGALIMRGLRAHEAFGREVSQALYEEIFSGFDYAYRETGVGDSSISRKVRKLGEEFFGLARGLDAALNDTAVDALSAFIQRNGLGGVKPDQLIDYLRSANKGLSEQLTELDESMELKWPSVEK